MASWLANENSGAAIWNRFQTGEVMFLLFNCFEGSNEGKIGREEDGSSSMVKCGEAL